MVEDEEYLSICKAASKAIAEALASTREEAAELRREANQREEWARRVEDSVRGGRWWEIQSIIGKKAADFLCGTEPTDRSELLRPEDW